MHVLVTCKYKKDWIKTTEKKWRHLFPHYKSRGFLLPWKPQFWSNLPQNLMQPFPHPSDATHKIWSKLANWSQRYSSLKVWTTTDDDDGPLVYYKLTLWAFGSGELKLKVPADPHIIMIIRQKRVLSFIRLLFPVFLSYTLTSSVIL